MLLYIQNQYLHVELILPLSELIAAKSDKYFIEQFDSCSAELRKHGNTGNKVSDKFVIFSNQ